MAEGEGGAKDGPASGSGAPAPAGAEPVVVGDLAAVQASLEAKLNGNGNGNGNGASLNGNGAAKLNGNGNGAALATVSIDAAEGVEGFLPPEEAGQLETAAQVGAGAGCCSAGGRPIIQLVDCARQASAGPHVQWVPAKPAAAHC